MAQRTVMRMSLAQMMAMDGNQQTTTAPPSTATAAAEQNDTIYFLTVHVTNPNTQTNGLAYTVVFGPSRSHDAALHAMAHAFPRTQRYMDNMGGLGAIKWEPNNHFKWTEPTGEKVLVRLEQIRSAAVCASSDQQQLFTVIRRVTDFDDQPPSEDASIAGVYLDEREATMAATTAFRDGIEGHRIGQHREGRKEDGMLFCFAQSAGEGGYRWTFEVVRLPWAR